TAFEREADQRQGAEGDGEAVAHAPALGDEARADQAEQGGVESRQTAVGFKLRLPRPHADADSERGGGERERETAAFIPLRHRAENDQSGDIPGKVIRAEMREVRGEEPPE